MKKVRYQTARVHWQMGQALLPDHFYAQEAAMREEINLRFRMQPTPGWGIGSLRWDPLQIIEGIISLQELTLVLPSGTLVDIPGNTAPVSYNLNLAGTSRTPVFVHLQGGFEVSEFGEGGDYGEEGVERVVQQIRLSSKPYSDSAVQSFKLAEFVKGVEGAWSLAQDFLPALIRVGDSPFFEGPLERMGSLSTRYHQMLVEEIRQQYLGGESLYAAKQCLGGIYEFRAFLANVATGIHPHAYDVFQKLHKLYLDVCLYREIEPSALELVYEHENLGPLLQGLMDKLDEQLELSKSEPPYLPFERREGLQVCQLNETAKKARKVFLLLQKPSVSAEVDLSGLKLAAESRVSLVHQRALRGIPFIRIEHPPFHHNFAAEVEFYAVSEGEEWDHAVREGRVSFFNRPSMRDLRAFVYWRTD